jgi:hypothetical protein
VIINVDADKIREGGIYEMSERSVCKEIICREPSENMQDEVVAAFRYLDGQKQADDEVVVARSLLASMVYSTFRYFTIGSGAGAKEVDKLEVENWRDMLAGQHSGGILNPYCSDISRRTIQDVGNLSLALYKIAKVEAELAERAGIGSGVRPGMGDFIDAYFESIKHSLIYDRRFVPKDLPSAMKKTHKEIIDGAFSEVRGEVESESFGNAVVVMCAFNEASKKGPDAAREMAEQMAGSGDSSLSFRTLLKVMEHKVRRMEERMRDNMLLNELGKILGDG